MAFLGRVVFSACLTLIVFSVAEKFHYVQTSSVNAVKSFAILLTLALLFLAWLQYLKASECRIRAKMAQNPATFSPDKIDCYVRVEGKLTSNNRFISPISRDECAYYHSQVLAQWQTKRKKPAKGIEMQRKPLLKTQSHEELEIDTQKERIYIETKQFNKYRLHLRRYETAQTTCPPQIQDKEDKKYKTYQVMENYAYHNDHIIAQGKLTRHADGRLFIKPTHLLNYPSFIGIRIPDTNHVDCVNNIVSESLDNALLKNTNIITLIINALLIFYITIAQNN
jgi:hypothetical protein